ncbi:MAG: trimethylamine methyltransferase family protein [Verrucomicrobia bacterium]|nr:trimethylamine methyltransferase family protein [Verrucomicrobiota bacterium]
MQVLNAGDVGRIHETTLEILESHGVWFQDCPAAAAIFESHGCRVADGRVRIPRQLFAECLRLLPDRNDLQICVTKLGFAEALGLRQGESHVGLIGNPYYIHDHAQGERSLTEADADDKFLVLDSLPGIEYDCCCTINASQRAANASFPDYQQTEVCVDYLRRRLGSYVRSGGKPAAIHSNIMHGQESNPRIHSPQTLKPLEKMEVLRHAILHGPRATETLLAQDTPLIWCNPISPLQYHPEQVAEIIHGLKAHGAKCYVMFSPEVMLGGTGPVTLAGALAQHNAEVMSGVILTQLVAPGTRAIYGSVSGAMDLRSADISLGSLESVMFNGGVVQLADFYGLPSRVQFGNSSARRPGVRAAVETAWGLQMGILAGANLVNTGLLDSTLMLSLEHLVLVDELTHQIRRAKAATAIDAEHLALEVIRQEGRPATNYMGHDHTLEHMKEAMYYSDFTGRTAKSYEDWYELAHQKVQAILRDGREQAAADPSIAARGSSVAARLLEDEHTWREGQDGWWRGYVRDLT